MKRITQSILLTVGVIVTACLLAGAAAGVHPEKRCYNEAGDEIPCGDSNYYQTQFAARATARKAGPTSAVVVASATASVTASVTASPSATPTNTEAATESPASTLTATQEASPTTAAQATSTRPPTSMVLVPVLLFGCAGILVVVIVVLAVRWLASRR